MLPLISADLDRMQELQEALSRPVIFCPAPEHAPTPPVELLGHVLTILDRPIIDISFPTASRMLTVLEREVLDKALWASVEILDDGAEG